jgi:hypothetical protein
MGFYRGRSSEIRVVLHVGKCEVDAALQFVRGRWPAGRFGHCSFRIMLVGVAD